MDYGAERAELVRAWAETTIKIWHDKIRALNIMDTNELLNSFTHHVYVNANGSAAKIEFAFNYYGKFVDMGVGTGVSLSEAGSPGINRKPKPWFSSTFLLEVQKLSNMLSLKFGEHTALMIAMNIDDNTASMGAAKGV